tara:strand:+ start:128 stop:1249 length:1122 start_codon:yes stop_codon:yes gene_type:complete
VTLIDALYTQDLTQVQAALAAGESPNVIFQHKVHQFYYATTIATGFTRKNITPLIYAIENRLEAIALCLLDYDAEPNPEGVFVHPLNLACKHGFERIVEKLLDKDAHINSTDELHAIPIIETLRAKMLARESHSGELTHASIETTKKIIVHLMKAGVSLNPGQDEAFNAQTPIYQAATGNAWTAKQLVDLLMTLGATINVQDNHGITLLEYLADPHLHYLPSTAERPLSMRQLTRIVPTPEYAHQSPQLGGSKLINYILKQLLNKEKHQDIRALQRVVAGAELSEHRREALTIVRACLARVGRIVDWKQSIGGGVDKNSALTHTHILSFLSFSEQCIFASASKTMRTQAVVHSEPEAEAEVVDEPPAKRAKHS